MNTVTASFDLARFKPEEQEQILSALEFATAAHAGQSRKSGQPFITHPVAVATTVAEWGMDAEAVTAALLHDTVEDTPVTLGELADRFGQPVADLVDGLTKLEAVTELPGMNNEDVRREATNENLRKLLLASTADVRVLLIKLADRRHNLQTLRYLSPESRRRIAAQSLAVFAPLADRLGMGQLKAEIEDLAFEHADPERYQEVKSLMAGVARSSRRYLERIKTEINRILAEAGLEPISVEARSKHLYSVHKKLAKVDGDITKIYDLVAVRIILPEVSGCYQAMGALHQHYKPLIYRIKDYIAVPKPNGYRSLHTTVFALDGRITEIQIRTPQMHDEAERGLAAHFYYDMFKTGAGYRSGQASRLPAGLRWVASLSDLVKGGSSDTVSAAELELFRDRIFVLSPKGDLYDLPEGSTALDFAFAVHSDLGLRTMGTKVNGRMVPLDTRLENRDMVEVLTRKEPQPNRDWLGFVQTTTARSRIRGWFRAASREVNVATGRRLLEEALLALGYKRLEDVAEPKWGPVLDQLHQPDLESLLACVGEGSLAVANVIRRLAPETVPASPPRRVVRRHGTGRIIFPGGHLLHALAPCCSPVFPQPIIGYVTRGSGVTVHRRDCPNVPAEPERLVHCRWEVAASEDERLVIRLELRALDRIGLLSDVASVTASRQLNLGNVQTTSTSDSEGEAVAESTLRFDVEVPDLVALTDLMRHLRRLPGVLGVNRIK